MADIVNLADRQKPKEPEPPEGLQPGDTWCATKAKCLACGHNWVGAFPIPTIELECPACGIKRGRSISNFAGPPGDGVYECACGNTLMEQYVTRVGNAYMLCVGCGQQHNADVKAKK